MLQVNSPLVSVNWLQNNLDAENLIIFDATIAKVGSVLSSSEKEIIPNAQFFDIKQVFSEQEVMYPNTILTSEKFKEEVQKLGVNNDSCIVVYDTLGVYSSPRVWWMFKLFGFDNIAVLDGGLPFWKKAGFKTSNKYKIDIEQGNFIADIKSEKIKFTKDVFVATKDDSILVADARSEGRFNATVEEPRKEVRGGHIPNSINIPYGKLLEKGKMKSVQELKTIFKKINPKDKALIFSCGSGITACILALGAELSNNKKYSVYDGSWTEWGSRQELPIEK